MAQGGEDGAGRAAVEAIEHWRQVEFDDEALRVKMAHNDPAAEALRNVFGFPAFRGPQREIIDHVTAGGDALVLMPTGGGKSLCYQVPALLREGVAVVVSPKTGSSRCCTSGFRGCRESRLR